MANTIGFEIVNLRAFQGVMQKTPKIMIGEIRKRLAAGGKRIKKAQEQVAGAGGRGGINIPAKQKQRVRNAKGNLVKVKTSALNRARRGHVVSKVNRSGSPVLVNYASKLLTFHHPKINPTFQSIFELGVPRINREIESEVVRLWQAALDKGLTDKGLRTRNG